MRLILFLLLVPIFIYSQTSVEVGYKLQLTNSLGGLKQLIIAFDSTTTDGFDLCCDAQTLGGPNVFLGIYTQLNSSYYSIMAYEELTTDRSISLYTSANPDVLDISFTIDVVDTIGYENTIVSISDSLFPDQRFSFPYNCVGPITGTRFTFHTSAPVNINVSNGCASDSGGSVLINNPNNRWAEELIYNGNTTITDITDTLITNLQSGSYEYKWYNQTGSLSHYFQVSNNEFNFDLIVPYTYLLVQDAYVIPEVIINSSYDNIVWDFGDGRIIYDDINPIHMYSDVGQYTLSVTVTSGECTKTLQETITVDNVFGFHNINIQNKYYQFYYGIDGRLHKK